MVIGFRDYYKDVDDNFKKQAYANVRTVLHVLDSSLAESKGGYVCGEDMTIADI